MAVTTIDQSLAIQAVNLALVRIGVSKTVVTLQDQTREAFTAIQVYDHEFRATLRSFPWPFATRYLALGVITGSVTTPVNADWIYAYNYPDDCIFARRIVESATARTFNENPVPFRVGREGIVLVVYTNDDQSATPPVTCLEYTAIFDCPAHLGDELFISALAWRLAASFAPSLARDSKKAEIAWAMFLHTIDTAAAIASKEGQQNKPGGAEWINARA